MKSVIKYTNDMPFIELLIKKDPLLLKLFEQVESVTITQSDDYFLSLVGAIISQQLSGKVAAVIYDRFIQFYHHNVSPKNILDTDKESLRLLGISYQKIKYLKSLADAVNQKIIIFENFEHMTDDEVIEVLTQVKGIGRWTAQMFLMFSLGREDVSAPLDLGLRKAYSKLKGEEVDVKTFELISRLWQPYRSIVSFFLWQSTD